MKHKHKWLMWNLWLKVCTGCFVAVPLSRYAMQKLGYCREEM